MQASLKKFQLFVVAIGEQALWSLEGGHKIFFLSGGYKRGLGKNFLSLILAFLAQNRCRREPGKIFFPDFFS